MDKQKMTALVIRAQQNDSNALNELLSGCYEDLYRYAYQTVKNEDIAADVTQESCMEIMTTLEKLRQPEAFMVWARRITYHQCTRYFRENQDLQPEENEGGETILDTLADEDASVMPETVTENKEFRQTMQDMLDALPPEQRSALMLYYYEKLSVKDIAQIQNTTEGTVKSRLNYGRKAVKTQVEDYEKKTGVRLHSIAPLPLLLFWLFKLGSQEAAKASAATAAGAAAAGGTVAAAGTAATTAASATTATAAGAATSAVLTKVAGGVLAAAVTAGLVLGGVALLQEEPTGETTTASIHAHDYGTHWESDQEHHWQICGCGFQTEPDAHTYTDRRCTACGALQPSEGLEFVRVEDGYAVSNPGVCADEVIVIPAYHDGVPIVAIGDNAFHGCTWLTGIVLPETVIEIGASAFSASGLTELVLPQSVAKIGEYAFRYCHSLTQLTLPNREVELAGEIFRGCDQLTHLVIPGGMRTVGARMFMDCSSLLSVTLEPGIAVIDDSAFNSCTTLTTVTLPESLTTIGSDVFTGCTSLKTLTLPSGLQTLGDSVFAHCTALTQLTMPDSVTYYGSNLFLGCESLVTVRISSAVESIGRYTFMNCTALTDIHYGGTIEQWEMITSHPIYAASWDNGTREITIHCVDGTLKNGTA